MIPSISSELRSANCPLSRTAGGSEIQKTPAFPLPAPPTIFLLVDLCGGEHGDNPTARVRREDYSLRCREKDAFLCSVHPVSETSQGVELYKGKERIACAGTRSCACGGKESILFSFSSMVAGIRVYSRLLASCYSSDDLRSKKALSFDSRVLFFLAKPSSFSISGSCRKRSESE